MSDEALSKEQIEERRKNLAMKISRELWESDTEAEERLQAKCRWEHMSRPAVILEWGDPREWERGR